MPSKDVPSGSDGPKEARKSRDTAKHPSGERQHPTTWGRPFTDASAPQNREL